MALPINIEDLINSKTVESVRIEFKKGWNPEEVVHSMCAFSNDLNETIGGYIIVGIEENEGIPILPPIGLTQKQVDNIQKEIVELSFKIQPNILPFIDSREFQDKHIIIIWITPGEQRPYTAPVTLGDKPSRRIYVRQGSITMPSTQLMEQRLRELAAVYYFDDRINTVGASINDLDLGLIQSYLQEIKSDLYDESITQPLTEIAIKMRIARGPKENVRPLNVGLLMFSRKPSAFFKGCKTNLITIENEEHSKLSTKAFEGPIHIQIRDILNYLNIELIRKYVRKSTVQAESNEFYNYPYQALEEGVVNALYHCGYDDTEPIEIRIVSYGSDRRIEIHSYPGPMPPIDEQSLVELKITSRRYRNIRIGEFLKNLKLAEEFATGIPSIVKSLAQNGSPLPILSTDKDRTYFLLTIKIHPDTPIDKDSSATEVDRTPLSNIQQQILDAITKEPSTNEELSKQFNEDIQSDMTYLLERGLIGVKKIAGSEIHFITQKGSDTLRQIF